MSTGYEGPLKTEREMSTSAVEVGRDAERVVPVVAEELVVEKRVVETGRVSVHKTVQEHEQVVDEPLIQETVEVERIPIHRIVEQPIPTRQEGDVTIISTVKEVLVVEKKLLFTEEVRITRRRSEVRDPQRVTLRSEEIAIERIPVADSPHS